MTTEQGNKLIAEFMGLHLNKYNQWSEIKDLVIVDGQEYSENWIPHLKYHSSWDWLHPVVDKIAEYKPNDFTGEKANVLLNSISAQIEVIWQAVVEFIEWYNKAEKVKESDTTMPNQGTTVG